MEDFSDFDFGGINYGINGRNPVQRNNDRINHEPVRLAREQLEEEKVFVVGMDGTLEESQKNFEEHLKFVRNLFAMFEEGKYCDCEIILKNNVSIPCHRIVLSQSRLLMDLFLEKTDTSSVIQIREEQIEPEIAKNILYFMYGHPEKVNLFDENEEKIQFIYPMFLLCKKWGCPKIAKEIMKLIFSHVDKIGKPKIKFFEDTSNTKVHIFHTINDKEEEGEGEDKEVKEEKEKEEEEDGEFLFIPKGSTRHIELLIKLLIQSYSEEERNSFFNDCLVKSKEFIGKIMSNDRITSKLLNSHPKLFLEISRLPYMKQRLRYMCFDGFDNTLPPRIYEVKENSNISEISLVDHIKSLFSRSLFTNLELVVKEQSIMVHKEVLICTSDYFRAMLSGPFEESSKQSIKMHDIEYSTLFSILQYLYSPRNWKETVFKKEKIYYSDKTKLVQYISKKKEELTAAELLKILIVSDKFLIEGMGKECKSLIYPLLTKSKLKFIEFLFDSGKYLLDTEERFKDMFYDLTKRLGMEQDIVDYLISKSKELAMKEMKES